MGEAVNIELKVNLKPFQERIIGLGMDYGNKYLCVIANRQCGKSFALRLLALMYLTEDENQTVGFITLTQRLAREFHNQMLRVIPKQIISKSDSSQLNIELVNGSQMLFWSLENIEVVRGFTCSHILWDETSFAREYTPNGQHIFSQILSPLLDAKGKKMVFASTPWAKTGLFWDIYNRCLRKEEGWDLVKKTVYDEMAECGVDEKWIREKKNLIGERAFKTEYECSFLDVSESSYFGAFEKLFILPSELVGNSLWFGLDFASVGSDNTILTAIDERNNVKQWEIDKSKGLDGQYEQIAKILNENEKKIKSAVYESNSIGEVMANQIKKLLNPNLRQRFQGQATTNKTKPDMIQNLSRSIERGDIHFEMANVKLKEELGTFVATINENTKYVTYAAVEGAHDDTVMSLAIALYNKTQKPQSSTPFIVVK